MQLRIVVDGSFCLRSSIASYAGAGIAIAELPVRPSVCLLLQIRIVGYRNHGHAVLIYFQTVQ